MKTQEQNINKIDKNPRLLIGFLFRLLDVDAILFILQDNFLPFFANIARSESEYFMRLPSDSNFDFKIRLATSKYSIMCDFSFDIQLASVVKNSILS